LFSERYMFQTTRRRLALWYTTVTAVLLLFFASGVYWYVRSTLIERIDDTLNHVVEIVQRSLVIEPPASALSSEGGRRLNLEASFRDNSAAVDDDHIDLEWFSPNGTLLWSTFTSAPLLPLHLSRNGETVRVTADHSLRQVTERVQAGEQVLGYLRVSHPWFEVTKPSRELLLDLVVGIGLMIICVAGIGWFLSGLAIAPIRDSYQSLKQFTADASHELRNPIASIQTNVQFALTDPDPQTQRQQLEVVERLTRRLGRLVDDLLFLARQDSGIAQPHLASVSVPALLMDIVQEQQAFAEHKAIQVTWSVSPDAAAAQPVVDLGRLPPDVRYSLQADRDQLARLFTNLLSNAIQYTGKGGNIHLRLQSIKRSGTSHLQISVTDNGVGIPTESLPQIFNRFYRVDPARSRSETRLPGTTATGSGLGLAIVKAIVENHHGQLQVESTVNQGTTVIVTLPQEVDFYSLAA
jgi:two-component system, OmpR family, manganese sensing sensor histidine kinase